MKNNTVLSQDPLDTSLQLLKGIGPSIAKRLEKLSCSTVRDFLYAFPRGYEDRRNLPKLSAINLGESQTVVGKLRHLTEQIPRPGLSILKGTIEDETGRLSVVWFNQGFLKKTLKIGLDIVLNGKIEVNSYAQETQMTVAETDILFSPKDRADKLGKVLPSYPLTAGLFQSSLRKLSASLLSQYLPHLKDPLPDTTRKQFELAPLAFCIQNIHFPASRQAYIHAKRRLVFDEFLYLQLAVLQRKHLLAEDVTAEPLITQGPLIDTYIANLPYTLTGAQQRAIKDIRFDIEKPKMMNRLIQGDVGAGKTDVAIFALLCAIETEKKGILMAPTEILAEQHFYKLKKHLGPLGIPITLLKGKQKVKERRAALDTLRQEGGGIVVGTHALLEDPVEIPDIGLVVIDEQHRFGVVQRLKLKAKGYNPHCLFMTATPIPRSLLLTSFGDLEKSIMDELPPGRIPDQTRCIRHSQLPDCYRFCETPLSAGHQVFVVYPLVEESEKLDLKSAIDGHLELQSEVFLQYKVGLIHGRMSAAEKADIMDQFKQNQIQILVATTVIEVGIDVPNATTMIIHHAERFGLSQLHQLRGRIGRGGHASYCFLVTAPKSLNSKKRLQAMVETTCGFKLAEHDLEIRGPGDMLGTRQAGLPDLQIADLVKDEATLLLARKCATELLDADPNLARPEHALLRKQALAHQNIVYYHKLN